MNVFNRRKNQQPKEQAPDPIQVTSGGGWDESSVKVKNCQFPGPAGVTEPLRVAMTKESYADLLAHAKESLDREICGVLIGDFCADEQGRFVMVDAAIRGGAAKSGGTHVTFTQETWNEIHKEKDARYPKRQIVGWYHSHPGFGVEFSDMDMFIQKNFFSGPSQIAYVSDPLGGQEAICANTKSGIQSIGRFWVDGRERRCYMPAGDGKVAAGGMLAEGSAGGAEMTKTVRELEDRIRQLTNAVDRQRTNFYNFLTFLGILAAMALLLFIGDMFYRAYYARMEVPQIMRQFPPIAIEVDGKPTLCTMAILKWEIPPELNTILVQAQAEVLKQQLAEEQKKQAAATQAATTQGAASRPKP